MTTPKKYVKLPLWINAFNNERIKMTEKIEIIRHKNGKIKSIARMEEEEREEGLAVADGFVIGDFYFSDPPRFVSSYHWGPYVEFYENGTVSCLGAEYRDLSWEKRFDSKGKLIKTFGKEGKFELTPKMQEILKKEKLLAAVNKALAAKKAPTLKSTLKRGTKSPRKKAGKEM